MARVFISCGQGNDSERKIAAEISSFLQSEGFATYVAIEAQNVFEINSGIRQELIRSDCYLLINFRRERIGNECGCSLFSHQEFAMAYALRFDKVLVVNQERACLEGMLQYFAVNTDVFRDYSDCVAVVKAAVQRSSWQTAFSRGLWADLPRLSDEYIRYGDLIGRFVRLNIQNNRSNCAAIETTGRLVEYWELNSEKRHPSFDRSPLKATGRPDFAHTIFPDSYETFDILCVGAAGPNYAGPAQTTSIVPVGGDPLIMGLEGRPIMVGSGFAASSTIPTHSSKPESSSKVYLNTALDLSPRVPLRITPGKWTLRYEFVAIDFPLLRVDIRFEYRDSGESQVELLSQSIA